MRAGQPGIFFACRAARHAAIAIFNTAVKQRGALQALVLRLLLVACEIGACSIVSLIAAAV